MFPKKKRIRDMKTLHQYREDYPNCEVCGAEAMMTPHHLKPVGGGGDDTYSNLISLCHLHHTGNQGWHPLGPLTWYMRFRNRLLPEALAKVQFRIAALGHDI